MSIFTMLADIIFPPKCVFCGKLTADDSGDRFLCRECISSLPWTSPSSGVTNGDFFVKCVSPLFYRGAVRDSVLKFKFGGKESYADLYGRLIAECLAEHPEIRYDLITWVPLSRRRLRTRGYNQARSLAEAVAVNTGAYLWKTVKKVRHTPAQSSLADKSQRRANISGAFVMDKSVDVTGLSVLIIDDVVTTASTLSECSRVLLTAGAERVYCATLAKAGNTKVPVRRAGQQAAKSSE
jgi:competence protein ComFC